MATSANPVPLAAAEQQFLDLIRGLLREVGSPQAAERVSLASSFERDLGLGSLERVELLVRAEALFRVELPDAIAQQAETPGEWLRALEARGSLRPSAKSRYRIEQPQREAPHAPSHARNWVEVLRHHAELEAGRVHIHLLEGSDGEDITYGRLLASASQVAAGLVARGLRRGDTVAIMLPTSADFFFAFFGVMLAGAVAVPIYPPARPDKIEEYVRRQVLILRNAEVRFLIAFDQVQRVSKIVQLGVPSLLGSATVAELARLGRETKPGLRALEPSEIAFIQYTSGSTGDPKGVVLSQANVLANVRGIGWAVKFRPTDAVVSWLPLYHDMGLIGSWLFSVYFGAPITVLSPLAFLSRPERWLWALHDSRGTLCPAPNFAYELCARKIPDSALEGLDLSAWRIAINAGEAVLPETLDRFEQRFKPYGFRAESYVPCYGLAESSVALAFPPIDRRPVVDVIERRAFEEEGRAVPAAPGESQVLRFVANGRALPGHEIRLVDDAGAEVGERVQGRVLFRGLSKTAGYYRNPEATQAAVDAEGWMDSGDLAYRADGEIYVTGRSKDLIIKAGHNLIPQEIEAAAAEVPGVRKGCVAAFGAVDAPSGTERLVVVAETRATRREERDRIEAGVIKAVDAAVGTPPDQVVLVPPQSVPKTSSGKIRRRETRRLFEGRQLVATRRPPWLQLVRLWISNFGAWIERSGERFGVRLQRLYGLALLATVPPATVFLARLAGNGELARGITRRGARLLLWLSGHRVALQGRVAAPEPHVLVANRVSPFDPLVLTAAVPAPFLLADGAAGLPAPVRAMLQPLVVPALPEEKAPPGGTQRQRVRRALEQGHSVLVFPDSAPGVAPSLSRYRLDALHAAVSTSSLMVPIGIRGTSRVLQPGRRTVERAEAKILVGQPLGPEGDDQRELVALRERIRSAISELCR